MMHSLARQCLSLDHTINGMSAFTGGCVCRRVGGVGGAGGVVAWVAWVAVRKALACASRHSRTNVMVRPLRVRYRCAMGSGAVSLKRQGHGDPGAGQYALSKDRPLFLNSST